MASNSSKGGKIIILCSNESMELALSNHIYKNFDLVGLIIETKTRSKFSFVNLLEAIAIKLLFYFTIDRAWIKAQKRFKAIYRQFPDVPKCFVGDVNSRESLQFFESLYFDLAIVSGTSLLRKDLLNLKPRLGFINLHTGLSPYIKGGPNCTNWCLSTKQFFLIGNTVMWLDEGIDSGNVICTQRVQLELNWSLEDLLYNVIVQGQELYLRSIELIFEMRNRVPSVPQESLGKGVTYYNKEWGFHARFRLVKNFYFGNYQKFVKSSKNVKIEYQVKLVDLPMTP